MENSYGIGVTNRYALFLDEDADPLEVLKVQEQEKELKKKTKIAEKENKGKIEIPAKGKVAVSQRKPIKESQNQKTHDVKREDAKTGQRPNVDNRNDRNRFNSNFSENREERNNKKNREERTFNGSTEGNREREERPRREFGDNQDNRTRGRGVVRPRGGRGGRLFDQRGKREFDRQSGSDKTGVKPVDKREGGGAHNWGSHKDIIEEIDKTNELDTTWGEVAEKPETPVATEVKPETGTPTDAETPAVEEEPKQITLDEWRAQRANRQKPQYNLRKAGEGEDPTQWKKMYELNKKKEGEEDDSDDEEYDASEYPQRVGRQKHVLDINIQFYSDRRVGGGGRGRGRNGPRGSRGGAGNGPPRGAVVGEREPRINAGGDRPGSGPRNYRGDGEHQAEEPPREHQHKPANRQNAPKVDDEHDFPSLS